METEIKSVNNWINKPLFDKFNINFEHLILLVILILALFTRFYNLESRVMSHDENSHVYYSWRLYKGEGFAHDPLMHGPLQFHMVALSYFMFGDNDFTARIPAAVFSIATVMFMWYYRRYLGRSGALVASILFLISPYLLYYGRYVRNEAYVAFFGVVILWAFLRYLETGKNRYLYWLTAATALHFTAKETAFIYTAQLMIFIAGYLLLRILKNSWNKPNLKKFFSGFLILGICLLLIAGLMTLINQDTVAQNSESQITATNETGSETVSLLSSVPLPSLIMFILSGIALIVSVILLVVGYSSQRLKGERSFDVLILLFTLVLPHLSALPARVMGWSIPTNAGQVQNITSTSILQIGIFLVPLILISVLIGIWWSPRRWLANAAIFYAIFTVFYTTVFTNGAGFFTGLVGSLGYWLEQQGVNRGSQPWYYYGLVQIPIYEYLPALGTILLVVVLMFRKWFFSKDNQYAETDYQNNLISLYKEKQEVFQAPFLGLIIFWSFTSLLAYTVAGEKMPWLTVHIAWPLILCAAWFLGKLIESINWKKFKENQGWLLVIVLIIFILSSLSTFASILGLNPPFQGKTLEQLRDTSSFVVSFITGIASGIGLLYLLKRWTFTQFVFVAVLTGFAFLGMLTARTSAQAAYINYDNANELLVYAHSGGGVKTALQQIEEISKRTTNGLAINVAYDNETSYPYWWYLRNYDNAVYFGADPTRSLRESDAILVGDANYGKIEPVVGQAYNEFEYIRIWWPNQDYYNLTWEKIRNATTDPEMRAALFQIWLNRDYSLYGQVTNKDMSLPNWSPSARMKLFIRKDIVNKLWNYGAVPSPELIQADPYEGKETQITADKIIGTQGDQPGQFNKPRGIAVAEDGSLFIADSDNNRIQHLSPDGEVINYWGGFGDVSAGNAPGGLFNQPWGIEVGPDGSVYVADTWNHRIQKFTTEGEFLTMWGYFGQGESIDAMWGPRDIAFDKNGNVYITDTGNKRVVIFDQEGNPLDEFGEPGLLPGQFDEPVGISIDEEGFLFIADTWNQRIQVFSQVDDESFTYIPETEWDVVAWYGQSLDNKPYLSAENKDMVYATDPEGYRILQFDKTGELIQFWGDYGTGLDSFGMPAGIAVDSGGGIWVSDAGNNRLMHFEINNP
jgi:predicted membrane-bound mannosyltransferase/DNA-binding beta-propeller fold protein YncE